MQAFARVQTRFTWQEKSPRPKKDAGLDDLWISILQGLALAQLMIQRVNLGQQMTSHIVI